MSGITIVDRGQWSFPYRALKRIAIIGMYVLVCAAVGWMNPATSILCIVFYSFGVFEGGLEYARSLQAYVAYKEHQGGGE